MCFVSLRDIFLKIKPEIAIPYYPYSGSMKKIILGCLLFLTIYSSAQSKDEIVVRKLLEEQTAAWNRGDIEGFMRTYWESDSLMFIGSSGVTYGWNNTLNRYKKSYPDTVAMGKLRFTLLDAKELSATYFHIMGKWQLQRTAGNLEGYFTLLIRKIKGSWVIIADHSS